MVSIENLKINSGPIEELLIVANAWGVVELHMKTARRNLPSKRDIKLRHGDITKEYHDIIEPAIVRLKEYFDGKEVSFFDVPLSPVGTSFFKNVWAAMRRIRWGNVTTYGELASRLNTIAQAVGSACSNNRIPIIIPCHRVLGAGNTLYAYGWGLDVKKYLLNLEEVSI